MPQLAISDAALDVLRERARQQASQFGGRGEGYQVSHDDGHTDGSLALAGAAYAVADQRKSMSSSLWPWDSDTFKVKDRRRNLVRATALLLAELERLDRIAARSADHG